MFRTVAWIFCRFKRQMGSFITQYFLFASVRSECKIWEPPSELLALLSNFTLFNRQFAGSFSVSFSCHTQLRGPSSNVDDIVNGGTYASLYRILSASKIIQSMVQLLLLCFFSSFEQLFGVNSGVYYHFMSWKYWSSIPAVGILKWN